MPECHAKLCGISIQIHADFCRSEHAPVWNPTLDDGVVLVMAPLWRLVPQHKPWQRELKSK